MKKLLIFFLSIFLFTTVCGQEKRFKHVRDADSLLLIIENTKSGGAPVRIILKNENDSVVFRLSTSGVFTITGEINDTLISHNDRINSCIAGSFWNKIGNFLFPKTLNDSVGIGTATPTEKFEVNGNIKADNLGLVLITEGGQTGYRLHGFNPANYGDIGDKAGDISYSGGSSSTRGATGDYSFASGFWSSASGDYSIAMGRDAIASGEYSVALGIGSTASGPSSIAMGSATTASGVNSTATGYLTYASGNFSTAMGRNITASGVSSFAISLGLVTGLNVTQANAMAIIGGYVGIGTIAPTEKLEIDGNIKSSGNFIFTGTASISTSGDNLLSLNGGTAGIKFDNSIGIGVNPSTHASFYSAVSKGGVANYRSLYITDTVTLTAHTYYEGITIYPVITANDGIHPRVVSAYFPSRAITGSSVITNLANLYIDDAHTYLGGTVTNGPYSIFVDAGKSRFDGDIGDATNRVPAIYATNINIGTGLVLSGSTAMTSVSTGVADNDKMITQGHMDDAIEAATGAIVYSTAYTATNYTVLSADEIVIFTNTTVNKDTCWLNNLYTGKGVWIRRGDVTNDVVITANDLTTDGVTNITNYNITGTVNSVFCSQDGTQWNIILIGN